MQPNSHLSIFHELALIPPDPIFNLTDSYKTDTSLLKINVGVGAYRTNDGKPYVLKVVRKAEQIILNADEDHEYLPIAGLPAFRKQSLKLAVGIEADNFAVVQCISGTGSLRVGAEFIKNNFPNASIYISNPTWSNHRNIFEAANLNVEEYRYYDPATRGLAFEEYKQDVLNAPNGSVFVLHACAHNPTGVDLTQTQWKEIAALIASKNHITFFDNAYQGFASGDLDSDAWAIRYFTNEKMECLVSSSFSKNFGLYSERIGSLVVSCNDKSGADRVNSQLCKIIRTMNSNCPAFGARIVSLVLSDPKLYAEWQQELRDMSSRIMEMRIGVKSRLEALKTPGTWDHVTSQIGMFSFTGLNKKQVQILKDKFHIYMVDSGRISLCGLNTGNLDYFCESVDWAVRNSSKL